MADRHSTGLAQGKTRMIKDVAMLRIVKIVAALLEDSNIFILLPFQIALLAGHTLSWNFSRFVLSVKL